MSNLSSYIENYVMQNHVEKGIQKKLKIQESTSKTNMFFGTLPFSLGQC
jgi:hypothetical protein